MTPAMVAPVLVAGPLAVAALLGGLGKWLGRWFMDAASLATAVAVTFGAAWLVSRTASGPISHWTAGWVLAGSNPLGIRLLVDPFGAGLAALAGLLVSSTFVFSWRYFDEIGQMYQVLILVLLAGICGLCMAGDLFNLFVFLEIASVSAYALTAYKVEESALVGALNFALTNTIGGVFVLIGIALVYSRTGALDMILAGGALGRPDDVVTTALALMLVGFLVKSAVAPFHFWLPDSYAVAPTPVAVLFGGVMLELGVFAIARVFWLVFAPSMGAAPMLRALLLAGGAGTAVLASVMGLLQRNIKRLLAFAAIAHVALLVIGVGLLDAKALAGTALAILAHGPLMGALFLCAGIVRQRHESVDELRLQGVGRDLPFAGIVFVVAAIALAAPPWSALDAGESRIHEAAGALGYESIRWVVAAVGVLTTGAILRAAGRVFLGWGPRDGLEATGPKSDDERTDEDSGGPDVGHPWVMLAPAAVLAAIGAFFSVLPAVRALADAWAAQLTGTTQLPFEPLHASLPSALSPAGGVLLAAILLGRHRFPAVANRIGAAVRPVVKLLQGAHTPHAGDHIGWLVLGAAIVVLVLSM